MPPRPVVALMLLQLPPAVALRQSPPSGDLGCWRDAAVAVLPEWLSSRVAPRNNTSRTTSGASALGTPDKSPRPSALLALRPRARLAPRLSSAPGSTSSLRRGNIDWAAWLNAETDGHYRHAAVAMAALSLGWLLVNTATMFFVPALIFISKSLKLTPEMAGAVVLPIGLSAPNLFAIGAAGATSDLGLVVGEMVGGNMVVLALAYGIIIIWANCQYEKKPSVRPKPGTPILPTGRSTLQMANGYLGGIVVHLLIFKDGTVYWYEATGLIACYAVYIAGVLRLQDARESTARQVASEAPELSSESEADEPVSDDEEKDGGAGTVCARVFWGLAAPSGLAAAAHWLLMWPAYTVRAVTIPPVDGLWDERRRVLWIMAPFCFAATILVLQPRQVNFVDYDSWNCRLVILLVGLALSICVLFLTEKARRPRLYPLMALLSIVGCVLLLSTVATEFTAASVALAKHLGFQTVFLGCSVIVWCDCLLELSGTLTLVARGEPCVAITTMLSGVVFDNFVSAGAAFLMATQQRPARLWTQNARRSQLKVSLLLGLCFILMTFFIIMTSFSDARFKHLPRPTWGILTIVSYCVFMAFMLVQSGIIGDLDPLELTEVP